MTWRHRAAMIALSAGLAVCGGCGGGDPFDESPWSGELPEPRLEIVVNFLKALDGRVPVRMRVTGAEGERFRFYLRGRKGDYRVHDLEFTDGSGNSIEYSRAGATFTLSPREGNVINVSYESEPGGLGRHGYQGAIGDDWAMFDGRLYLAPANLSRIKGARVRFITPQDWTTAYPFREEGGWYYLDSMGASAIKRLMLKSCAGVGKFDQVSRRIGETDFTVSSYSAWTEQHKRTITESSFLIAEYFHDTLAFDLKSQYSVVWGPMMKDEKVFGGSYVNGTCFQQPVYRLRNYELLSHRLAHSMNKYEPTGMKIRTARDHWFKEGWASYIEVVATQATGIARPGNDVSWNSLHRRFKRGCRDNPELNIRLAEEQKAAGDTEEFIHYRKAPLAAKMLSNLVRWRSEYTMEEYMRWAWGKYGSFQRDFPVQRSLEEFSGASFEDFWVAVIDRRTGIVPAWDGYLTAGMRGDMKNAPAARAGGEPISGDYLYYLAGLPRFKTFEAVRRFVITEETRRRDLNARGVKLYPDDIREHLFSIPPDDRYAIATLEASYPMGQAPRKRGPLQRVEFVVDHGNADGRVFAELLDIDRAYIASAVRGNLSGIDMRVGQDRGDATSRLSFGPDSELEIHPRWRSGSGRVDIELLTDGEPTVKWMLLGGTARKASARVGAGDRPFRAGVIAFRVEIDGKTAFTRGYWQRGRTTGRQQSAVQVSRERALKSPGDSQLWFRYATVLTVALRYEEALEAFRKAAELDSDNPRKWLKHGQTLDLMGRHAEAIESFDRALEFDEDFLAARGSKALALAGMNRRDASLAQLATFVNEHPAMPSRLLWKGRVLQELGDLDEAVDAYREYVEALPKRTDGWLTLGDGLLALERFEESVSAYDAALRLDPENERAATKRQEAVQALRKAFRRS